MRAAGAIVTLATGRAYRSAIVNCAALDIEVPIASSQGAFIANPVSGEVLRHCPMTEGMALITIDALETHIGRSGADVQGRCLLSRVHVCGSDE